MDYSKFYTPPKIADLLVKQLRITHPQTAIDICCGSHNLLNSAQKRWNGVQLIGIDIIDHLADNITCIKSDGREYALHHIGEYPLVLANPPFSYMDRKGDFPALYDIAPPNYGTSRLEVEMLLANLKLLSPNGTLMIIMPSTFVESTTYIEIRKYLAKQYHVQKVIKLPDETFGGKHISSYALVIKHESTKYGRTKYYTVEKQANNFEISEGSLLPKSVTRSGYLNNSISSTDTVPRLDIRRGNISSNHFVDAGQVVLHTAKLQTCWAPTTRYVPVDADSKRYVYAEAGDIIVSRIGKSAGRWHQHQGEKCPISDCLYRIKDPTGDIFKTLRGNTYTANLRGVATRYITVKDFEYWIHSLS